MDRAGSLLFDTEPGKVTVPGYRNGDIDPAPAKRTDQSRYRLSETPCPGDRRALGSGYEHPHTTSPSGRLLPSVNSIGERLSWGIMVDRAEMSDAVVYQRSEYPSRGTWLLWLAAMLLVTFSVVVDFDRSADTAAELSAWFTLLVLWLVGMKLTVTVTFTELRLAFLPGWPRKRINRSDIRSVTPVRDWSSDARAVRSNSLMWVRSARDGVLIVLVTGKRLMVRADDPDALAAALSVSSDVGR